MQLLQSQGKAVYLVSGGFRPIINPIADSLNISRDHVFANTILFEVRQLLRSAGCGARALTLIVLRLMLEASAGGWELRRLRRRRVSVSEWGQGRSHPLHPGARGPCIRGRSLCSLLQPAHPWLRLTG